MKHYVHKRHTGIFIAALFKLGKIWKYLRYPTIRDWKTNFGVFILLSYQEEWILIIGNNMEESKTLCWVKEVLQKRVCPVCSPTWEMLEQLKLTRSGNSLWKVWGRRVGGLSEPRSAAGPQQWADQGIANWGGQSAPPWSMLLQAELFSPWATSPFQI